MRSIRNGRLEQGWVILCIMQLPYVKLSPGGNITILVFQQVHDHLKPDIARKFMSEQPDVEQVGFIEKAHEAQAVARLQMSGAEFCGNAARCYAWLHSLGKGIHPHQKQPEFYLEVSGASRLLKAVVDNNHVKMDMPVFTDAGTIKVKQQFTIVPLEGITHVITWDESLERSEAEARYILSSLSLLEQQAAGVVYCQPYLDSIKITPVVWVRDTGTLIAETACASGSISVVLSHAVKHATGTTNLQILQPSGSSIEAAVTLKSNQFSEAYIKGTVEILYEGCMEYSYV